MATLLIPGSSLNWHPFLTIRRGTCSSSSSKGPSKCVSGSKAAHSCLARGSVDFASKNSLSLGRRSMECGLIPVRAAQSRDRFLQSHLQGFSRVGFNGFVDFPGQRRRRRRSSAAAATVEDGGNGEQSSGGGEVGKGGESGKVEEKESSGVRGLKEDVEEKSEGFWAEFKERHRVYRVDRDEWGVGFNPIFHILEDENGKVSRVEVDENEVLIRSGADPRHSDFVEEETRDLVETRLRRAKSLAYKIESGSVKPSRLSIVYKFTNEAPGNPSWISTAASKAIVPLQYVSTLVVFLPIVVLGLGGKWLLSKKKDEEDPAAREEKLRVMQMRKLRAQANREPSAEDAYSASTPGITENGIKQEQNRQVHEEVPVEVVSGSRQLDDDEYQKKVSEIQAMARKARLQEQEEAEFRSAHSQERRMLLEQGMQERSRSKELENLAQDLDSVRRLGAEGSDDFHLSASEKLLNLENDKPSTIDSPLTKQSEVSDSPLKPRNVSKAPPIGVRPRIILNAEEARASIAAKKAKLGADYKSHLKSGEERYMEAKALRTAKAVVSNQKMHPVDEEIPALEDLPQVDSSMTEKKGLTGDESLRESQDLNGKGGIEDKVEGGKPEKKGKDEVEEEMEWMRDDVLREIVFKVQANEEAGREPFHNLNSEQETLFFKGLERKFDREGDNVKKWIQDRVENIDYGSAGISVYDTPESYQLKWKEGAERPPESELTKRFKEDRERILNERRGWNYTSSPESSKQSSPSAPAAAPPSSVPQAGRGPPTPPAYKAAQGQSKERVSTSGKSKTVISSTPRSSKPSSPEAKENWDHTKRWAKDLEMKYAMEKDPDVRAVMREMGQDLDRWITEDEIREAGRLLEQGAEGEKEYAKMHYEKTRAKIKQQREMFGEEAMLAKYAEYKPQQEESELWWFDLPFVVCIGMSATMDGEDRAGLYSVDVGPSLEGVPGLPKKSCHTVAFEDRGDAQNFCRLINSQPENVKAAEAEPVGFHPKDLYRDCKEDGYHVTVIKKGQLQLSVDQSFEEVEGRIIELGGAIYFDKMISDRSIDMHSVIDEGFGFGRPPRT